MNSCAIVVNPTERITSDTASNSFCVGCFIFAAPYAVDCRRTAHQHIQYLKIKAQRL
jgi:hypothetical protein